MKRSIATWTSAAAAAALLTLPASSAAQTSPTTQPPTTRPTTTTQPTAGSTAAQQPSAAAQEHLRQARTTLDAIKTATLNARAKTQVAELKRRLATLERTAGANDNASATGQANRNARATAARGNANWGTEVAAIDKILTTLLGTASASASAGTSTSGTATTGTATTGTTGSTAGAGTRSAGVTLDENTRTQLTEFRTHITAYATAMAGGSAQTPDATAATDPTSSATSSTSSTSGTSSATGTTGAPTSGTAGSATGSTSGSSGSMTSPATPQTAQGTGSAQVDQEAARRHLTEARNSLSAMTQLPAAAQLTGDARTHVAQLISNFNELITTQAEWRASYAKVEANLTALLGPNAESATAATATTGTATPPAPTGTPGAPGTPGAVGTSGGGVPNLDPALRDRLIEMRKHLTAFEKAAGGEGSAGQPDATAATAGTSGMTTSGTTAGGTTTGTTGGTSATGTTGSTTGTTGTTASGTSATNTTSSQATGTAQQGQSGQAELARHLAAIDALLQTQDESGGLTLTKAQVEQLRTHWTAVRQMLSNRRQ